MRRKPINPLAIPEKANVVLNLILIALIVVAIRIWHLAVVQYEEKFEQSKKPQRKNVVEYSKRGTIRDRFNIPLALNKISYRAGVSYAPIRQIPSYTYELSEEGKKTKVFKRKEYIRNLAELLGRELNLDENRIEDLIYAKAALYFNIPYILKNELNEEQYYRLRMLEKDWPGLVVQKYSKREYPKGPSLADVVGYMGAISREEYEKIIIEKKQLEEFLQKWEKGEDPPLPGIYSALSDIRKRYQDLESLAYTAQDYVGKTGIEALFEQQLRGFQGKKTYYADSKGNLLQELPGSKPPVAGKRIILSISQELQEYAEILLAQNEEIRVARSAGHGKKIKNKKQPWIKGGAIVVLDPSSGEVLTLATYPRFNPNDFVSERDQDKKMRINQWFENDAHFKNIWNEVIPLEKERYNESKGEFYFEKKEISWPAYLEFLLPKDHLITQWFDKHSEISAVVPILQEAEELEKESGSLQKLLKEDLELQGHPLAKRLEFLPTAYTKLLFLDCCQLAVNQSAFSTELLRAVGKQTIALHKSAGAAYLTVQNAMKEIAQDLFHREVFHRWRQLNEKAFLKQKRQEEKDSKSYPKPYIDYLDEKERELFASFWTRVAKDYVQILLRGSVPGMKSNTFIDYFKQLHQELIQGAHPALSWRKAFDTLKKASEDVPDTLLEDYLASLRSYDDLNRPLKGKYRLLRNRGEKPLEKHLASAIYPTYGFGYGRSFAYRQASTQGSIFKMVTAHEALLQSNETSLKQGKGIKFKNPLEIIDDIFKIGSNTYVGYNSLGKPISQIYKGGRIPRSHAAHMGKMDLLQAIETSSNPYFSLLAGDVLKNPEDLANAARSFGFGKKTGIDLPGEIPGRIPKDLETNRTGLYATAIGQHSLVVTPLQTAVFLSTFANGGELLKPQIIKFLIGSSLGQEENWLYEENVEAPLAVMGLDFPLFEPSGRRNKSLFHLEFFKKTIVGNVEMSPTLRNFLLEGMRRVVMRTQHDSLGALSRLYADYPEAISDYVDFKNQIVGKTSTSESMERIDMDEFEGTNLYTHVWFGGISFERDVTPSFEHPELVVVVYLRYGAFGKEAAPLAAQMVRKWREIKQAHELSR